MFGKKKKKQFRNWKAFDLSGEVEIGSNSDHTIELLERASLRHEYGVKQHELLMNKVKLILSHLNLEYVPETEKKEPAKLVRKSAFTFSGLDVYITDNIGSGYPKLEQKKKKRGRPKKK